MFRDLINEKVSLDSILADIEKLGTRDRVIFRLKLLGFGQPRLQSIAISETPRLEELIRMDPEARKELLFELIHGEKIKNA